MNITKLDLCSRVSKKFDKTASELKPILEAFLEEIVTVLAEGQRIEIRGFGSFQTKKRKKRLGRNPRTGETVDIPPHTAPLFKFSKDCQKLFDLKKGKKVKKRKKKEETPKNMDVGDIVSEILENKILGSSEAAPSPAPMEKTETKKTEEKTQENPTKSAETFSPT